MQRRRFAALAVGSLTALAGCTTISKRAPFIGPEPPPSPSADAPPSTYIPSAGGPWTETERQGIAAGQADAEAGIGVNYAREGQEDPYYVEIMRWPSADAADSTASDWYGGWKSFILRGQFSFAGRGPSRPRIAELLGRSPVLTVEWVEAYDRGRG